MNCRRFQNELFEYVEGTLSADALAVAEKHLTECETCRRAVEKEKRVASVVSSRLRQSSQALTLSPEIRRNILTASRQIGSGPTRTESLIDLCRYWIRITAIPAAMLLIAGVFLAVHFSGAKSHETNMPRAVAVTSPVGKNPQISVSVQMSYRSPRREFHQEGNVVLDAFVSETVVINGTFQEEQNRDREGADADKESGSQPLQMKTPL
ncbi:MAG TPA: zf-HC2 domain-containing protein [Verrucomicrobiae bacterium]|jgi:predicted anti-sigma-YlaC factor YlaD